MDLPTVACLCPTAWRPWCLENAIACFEAQEYPADRRRLFILDDSDTLTPKRTPTWEVVVSLPAYATLTEKYNRLLELARGYDYIAVWEDDDIYTPVHLSNCIQSMRGETRRWQDADGRWCDERVPSLWWAKPSTVWSLYTGRLEQENALGRFHASIVVPRDLLESVGGWTDTPEANFDQQLLARLAVRAERRDPTVLGPPTYVFRWGSTNAPHGQGSMRSPNDTDWYPRAYEAGRQRFLQWRKETGAPDFIDIQPRMDAETRKVYGELGFSLDT